MVPVSREDLIASWIFLNAKLTGPGHNLQPDHRGGEHVRDRCRGKGDHDHLLRRRAVLQPAEPDHPPPPAVAPETPMNRIGLERRLRRELTATSGLHILHDFSGSSADINGLTYEALNLSIEVCRRETKRDTTLWITNAELEYEHQQRDGIRATIRFRGYIQSPFVPVPEWMKRARWTRMTFLRKRESSDPWTLFELTAG